MPKIPDEQSKTARSITLLEYMNQTEPHNIIKKHGRHIHKNHDSFVIDNGKGEWYWNSQNTGGRSALDYLVKIEGMSFKNAVKELIGDITQTQHKTQYQTHDSIQITSEIHKSQNRNQNQGNQNQGNQEKQLKLPPAAPNNDKAIEYLVSRGLSQNVAKKAIASGIMYQSINNTCVFIGKDGDKPKYAYERSIDLNGNNKNIKKDTFGSDKKYNFCIPAKDRSSKNLAVFESPIDALAHYELCRLQEKEWDGYRLSLGG